MSRVSYFFISFNIPHTRDFVQICLLFLKLSNRTVLAAALSSSLLLLWIKNPIRLLDMRYTFTHTRRGKASLCTWKMSMSNPFIAAKSVISQNFSIDKPSLCVCFYNSGGWLAVLSCSVSGKIST